MSEKTVICGIAVSFLVMIIAVTVSSGFRHEIRSGISEVAGDISLTGTGGGDYSGSSSISREQSFLPAICGIAGVQSVSPAVYRAGIVREGQTIQGVLFKGVEGRDSLCNLGVSIPSRLSAVTGLGKGDTMTAYFVGERLKVRKFTIKEVYPSILETDKDMLVYASMDDIQRLNGWDSTRVSALEIRLDGKHDRKMVCDEAGYIALNSIDGDDDTLIATSSADKYPQIFQWLDLIDFNVLVILVLMTVVAGFNMISGLLIILFRNTSTIGTLKSMGMTDRNISRVFLRVSSRLVLMGMAAGNALALLFCLVQGRCHILKLNPANYFVPFVPVHVNMASIIAADVAAYIAIMIILLVPCRFISKVDPSKTLRAK